MVGIMSAVFKPSNVPLARDWLTSLHNTGMKFVILSLRIAVGRKSDGAHLIPLSLMISDSSSSVHGSNSSK